MLDETESAWVGVGASVCAAWAARICTSPVGAMQYLGVLVGINEEKLLGGLHVGAMFVAVGVGRGCGGARYPIFGSPCLAIPGRCQVRRAMLINVRDILHGPMQVAFRHGSNSGRVRVSNSCLDVRRSLADGLGSRGDSVGASSGE